MEATNPGHVYQCDTCGKLYLEQFQNQFITGALYPKCIRLLDESEAKND